MLRIGDVYPGSRSLILTHPGSRIQKQQQNRWVKKICSHTIFCSHKFHKIENYFIFEMLKGIIWANFQRIVELFTQKITNKLSKIWVWVPGSGKNLFRIPDPGVIKAPDPGSGSVTLICRHNLILFPVFLRTIININSIHFTVQPNLFYCLARQVSLSSSWRTYCMMDTGCSSSVR